MSAHRLRGPHLAARPVDVEFRRSAARARSSPTDLALPAGYRPAFKLCPSSTTPPTRYGVCTVAAEAGASSIACAAGRVIAVHSQQYIPTHRLVGFRRVVRNVPKVGRVRRSEHDRPPLTPAVSTRRGGMGFLAESTSEKSLGYGGYRRQLARRLGRQYRDERHTAWSRRRRSNSERKRVRRLPVDYHECVSGRCCITSRRSQASVAEQDLVFFRDRKRLGRVDWGALTSAQPAFASELAASTTRTVGHASSAPVSRLGSPDRSHAQLCRQ